MVTTATRMQPRPPNLLRRVRSSTGPPSRLSRPFVRASLASGLRGKTTCLDLPLSPPLRRCAVEESAAHAWCAAHVSLICVERVFWPGHGVRRGVHLTASRWSLVTLGGPLVSNDAAAGVAGDSSAGGERQGTPRHLSTSGRPAARRIPVAAASRGEQARCLAMGTAEAERAGPGPTTRQGVAGPRPGPDEDKPYRPTGTRMPVQLTQLAGRFSCHGSVPWLP